MLFNSFCLGIYGDLYKNFDLVNSRHGELPRAVELCLKWKIRMMKRNFVVVVLALVFNACSPAPESQSARESSFFRFAGGEWLLQDLSILFPIPETLPDPHAIRAADAGTRGKLLPDYAGRALPQLVAALSTQDQVAQLQLTGLRVEVGELHLVWQPFHNPDVNGQRRILAHDTAVHTFYRIDDDQAYLGDLKELAQLSRGQVAPGQPLEVHPSLKNGGWNQPYGIALKNLILKWAGEQNLFKITFSSSPRPATWFFGGFNVQMGRTLPLEIPRIHSSGTQLFANASSTVDFLTGITSPGAPSGQDAFNRLLMDSSYPQVKEPQALKEAHLTAVRIANPRLGNPDTLDCASCHASQAVQDWTEDKSPGLREDMQDRFTSPGFNLNRVAHEKINTENTRAFGYFLNHATVSQRAINDTAFLAERLSTK